MFIQLHFGRYAGMKLFFISGYCGVYRFLCTDAASETKFFEISITDSL